MDATYLLSLLPLLACPVVMGGMMWFMMRAGKGQGADATAPTANNAGVPTTDPGATLAELRAQLRGLEGRQATLGAELDRLSADDGTVPAATGPSPAAARRAG